MTTAELPPPPARARAPRPPPPTHFFALRLDCPSLHAKVEAVQEGLVAARAELEGCVVPASKLHVTMGLLHLRSDAEVESARAVLARAARAGARGPIAVSLPGLGIFGRDVLFLRVAAADGEREDDPLRLLASTIRDELRAAGFPDAQPDFKPHATVMKTSKWRPPRPPRRNPPRRKKKATPAAGDDGEPAAADEKRPRKPKLHLPEEPDTPFGLHTFRELQLLKMRSDKADVDADPAYYPIVDAITLGPPPVADSEEVVL